MNDDWSIDVFDAPTGSSIIDIRDPISVAPIDTQIIIHRLSNAVLCPHQPHDPLDLVPIG